MKIKIILLIVFCLAFGTQSFSQELVKGTITATPQNVLSVGTGDKIITNLGKKDGVVKGDILNIVESDDDILIGHIGKCVIVKSENTTSVCEIIKLSAEAGKGDYVFMRKIEFSDPQLYQLVFATLDEIVAPYETHRDIKVYVHNIYDEKNNITGLSEKIRAEVIGLLEQKNRIFVNTANLSEYITYPDKYFYLGTNRSKRDAINVIKDVMRRSGIDVIIIGSYNTRGGNLNVELYLIDKNWLDKKVSLALDAKGYNKVISEIVSPYKPIKEKQYAEYKILYKPKNYFPSRDEKRDIIKSESDRDLTFRYNVSEKKMDFNRISPDNFKLKVDEEVINLTPGKEYKAFFEKGMKRVWVSFQPGFFMNEELLYTSRTKTIEKEVILDLSQEGNLNLELTLDPTYGMEKIDIRVIKKITDEPIVAKPVTTEIEKRPAVEVFKD